MNVREVFSFWVILKESFKLIPKNWKLFGLVTLFSVVLSLIIYVAFDFSVLALSQATVPEAKSFVLKRSLYLQDEYDDMTKLMAISYAVEVGFMFILLVIFFFTTMATILVSAVSYTGGTLSVKGLFTRLFGTWTKPFLTCVHVSIQSLGFLPILLVFAAPVFLYSSIITVWIAGFLAIVVLIFYLYFVVNWVLAVVVSVVEEGRYGMAAMGRASELSQGQRVKGYMLTLFFFLVNLIISVVYVQIAGFSIPSSSMIYGLILEIVAPLVGVFETVAYTVLYFHCKREHGEEAEIDIGGAKYTLLPTNYPVD